VQQEASDKFLAGQDHHFTLIAVSVILPFEANLVVLDSQKAVVGDRYPVGIAAHVMENLLWSGEWPLGVNHPPEAFCSRHVSSESARLAKGFETTEEAQFAGVECFLQSLQK
jgi:hypothetical protein